MKSFYKDPVLSKYRKYYDSDKSFKALIRDYLQDVGYRNYSLKLKNGNISTPCPCYRHQYYKHNHNESIKFINIKRGRWILADNDRLY